MSYVGGKATRSGHILALLNHPDFDGMDYLEPFVGYGHILRRVERKRSYRAFDNNPLLVVLLNGVRAGKRFPRIHKPTYEQLRYRTHDLSFRRAVAAFAYSYKGMEWGGYFNECPQRNRWYAEEHERYYKMLRQNEVFMKARIRKSDYRDHDPRGMLIYCDPPYKNTTGYSANTEKIEFDHDEFWDTMRRWSRHNIVFISEYRAPRDFACVARFHKYCQLAPCGKPIDRFERVFVLRTSLSRVIYAVRDVKRAMVSKTLSPSCYIKSRSRRPKSRSRRPKSRSRRPKSRSRRPKSRSRRPKSRSRRPKSRSRRPKSRSRRQKSRSRRPKSRSRRPKSRGRRQKSRSRRANSYGCVKLRSRLPKSCKLRSRLQKSQRRSKSRSRRPKSRSSSRSRRPYRLHLTECSL